MSLNIKNERVHDLARRASELTGKTKTAVIEEALTDYVAKVDVSWRDDIEARWAVVDEAIAKAEAVRAARPPGQRKDFTEADLYDPETGLPA